MSFLLREFEEASPVVHIILQKWHAVSTFCVLFGGPLYFSFLFSFKEACGHVKAILLSMLAENYAVRFLPRENGIHLIHVYFKDTPIPGSPFKVRVGGHDMIGDPGMVHAYGDGLEKGKTGRRERSDQFLRFQILLIN